MTAIPFYKNQSPFIDCYYIWLAKEKLVSGDYEFVELKMYIYENLLPLKMSTTRPVKQKAL